MENYTVTLPHYSVGSRCYEELGPVAALYGRKVAVVGGETALQKAGAQLKAAIEAAGLEVTEWSVYGKDATMANVRRIVESEGAKAADIVFGVGGGRAIDTVKAAADFLGKPFFSFPTVASNCAPISAISVLYHEDGSLDCYHFPKRCPDHCFVNTSAILDSPEPLFWAGIGDALSKQIESQLASRGRKLAHTPLMGVQMGLICEAPLMEYGRRALEDFRSGVESDAFVQVVLDIIISTGIVSNLVTTRDDYYYNSSLAHCFYNASMVLPAVHKHLHGEVVSFGNLVLEAADGCDEDLERFVRFNASIGLPVTLEAIDITSEADLDALIERAPSIREWKCVPYEMTKEKFRAAILKADAAGRAFLARR